MERTPRRRPTTSALLIGSHPDGQEILRSARQAAFCAGNQQRESIGGAHRSQGPVASRVTGRRRMGPGPRGCRDAPAVDFLGAGEIRRSGAICGFISVMRTARDGRARAAVSSEFSRLDVGDPDLCHRCPRGRHGRDTQRNQGLLTEEVRRIRRCAGCRGLSLPRAPGGSGPATTSKDEGRPNPREEQLRDRHVLRRFCAGFTRYGRAAASGHGREQRAGSACRRAAVRGNRC